MGKHPLSGTAANVVEGENGQSLAGLTSNISVILTRLRLTFVGGSEAETQGYQNLTASGTL